jgi:hypothetical protein
MVKISKIFYIDTNVSDGPGYLEYGNNSFFKNISAYTPTYMASYFWWIISIFTTMRNSNVSKLKLLLGEYSLSVSKCFGQTMLKNQWENLTKMFKLINVLSPQNFKIWPSGQLIFIYWMKIADIGLIYEAIFGSVCQSSGAVYSVGLRPLACWDWGFECHQGHVCLSWVVCVVR